MATSIPTITASRIHYLVRHSLGCTALSQHSSMRRQEVHAASDVICLVYVSLEVLQRDLCGLSCISLASPTSSMHPSIIKPSPLQLLKRYCTLYLQSLSKQSFYTSRREATCCRCWAISQLPVNGLRIFCAMILMFCHKKWGEDYIIVSNDRLKTCNSSATRG